MQRVLLLTLLLTVGLVLPHPTAAAPRQHKAKLFPVTITDDHGNKIRLARRPKRIATLDPRDTEIAFALGLEGRLVADGGQFSEGAAGIVNRQGKPRAFTYPSEWPSRLGRDYPVRAKELTHVEGGFGSTSFNLETIEKAQPDLVIGPYSKTELPTFQKMRDLGIKVMMVDPSNIGGIVHDIALVGRATGTTEAAKTVTAAMKKRLATVKARLSHVKSHPKVYYEIDATNPTQPYTAGPGTYIDEGIRLAGGKNVADTVTTCSGTLCYPQFSLETLVQLDPQYIIFSIYERLFSSVTVASIKSRTGWGTISAVKTGTIREFNDDLLSRGGPRNVIGIEVLARTIHPEAFKKKG